MHRINTICYPRSGFRLLARVISAYFGDEYVLHSVYTNKTDRQKATYIKNHDFELNTDISSNDKYLIQMRYPLDSIVSYFELQVGHFGQPDDKSQWMIFANARMDYWLGFYKKWIENNVSNSLPVSYDDLVDNPIEACTNVIRFVSDKDEIDHDRIKEIVASKDIKASRNIKDFRYYDKVFFNELRQKVSHIPYIDGDKLRISGR
jgi:hypothetical protein